MHIDSSGRDDFSFAGNHFRSWSNYNRDFWLYVGITCFTDCRDASVFDSDISFDNSTVVKNERVGYYGIDGAFTTRTLRLAHPITNDLSPSKLHLYAIAGEVMLHLDYEIRVCEAYLVADRRAKHLCIGVALHRVRHLRYLIDGKAPMTAWWKP